MPRMLVLHSLHQDQHPTPIGAMAPTLLPCKGRRWSAAGSFLSLSKINEYKIGLVTDRSTQRQFFLFIKQFGKDGCTALPEHLWILIEIVLHLAIPN